MIGGGFDFGFGEDMVWAVEMNKVPDFHLQGVDAFAMGDWIGFEKPDPAQMEDSAGAPPAMEVVGAHVSSRVQWLWDTALFDLTEIGRFLVHQISAGHIAQSAAMFVNLSERR